MLAAIVEARRREEQALQLEAERALAKRKKFKEVSGWYSSLFALGNLGMPTVDRRVGCFLT